MKRTMRLVGPRDKRAHDMILNDEYLHILKIEWTRVYYKFVAADEPEDDEEDEDEEVGPRATVV